MNASNKFHFKYLIDNSSKIRDVSLLALAGIYGMGYVVWAIYAWSNNLGFLPALDFQYFIAGFLPSIIVCIAIFIWKISMWFLEEILQSRIRKAIGIWKHVPRFYWITFVLFMVVVFYLEEKNIDSNIVAFSFIFGLLMPDSKIGKMNVGALLRRITAFVYLLFLVLISLVFYIDGYEKLPQAVGGVKPRCASIDIFKQNISLNTLSGIFDVNNLPDSFNVIRSVELDVLYSNDDILIVKPRGEVPGLRGRTSYEIPKKEISIIFWCDDYFGR